MADLVTIVGPIAGGKGVVSARLAALLEERGSTAVLVDVDDVADMVRGRGAGTAWLWPAAHAVHGALVAGWLATAVDVVIAVGNIYDEEEQRALEVAVPAAARVVRVVLDAPLAVTWERANGDPARGISRERGFHERRHARFRALLPAIPADLTLDTTTLTPEESARAILAHL
ncbi:AAA family ATPase [Pseudactinotalea terrae]|uniref:AAA family ATPase n=1 Tax=Pseudactinotalea terrae TaxID=1743262 RepID=UPI0012E154C4|nr:AAA family ATPase [Pseudactinotalea terrae]